jgi:enoyl-[acyl-carrier-protein] reductase (NADH)
MTERPQAEATFQEKVITRVLASMWGGTEDLGGIAVYLASDASACQCGDMFAIDGGNAVFRFLGRRATARRDGCGSG